LSKAEYNSIKFIDIIGIGTGLVFLFIYLFPVEGKVVAGSLYLFCALLCLLVMAGSVGRGIDEEKRLYPTVGVFVCSVQLALRIFLGIQNYNLLLGYLIPILGILGFAYILIDWWKTKRRVAGFVLIVSLGGIAIFGLSLILALVVEDINLAFALFDWVFYSIPILIGSALIAYSKNIPSWIIFLAFVPFLGLELFPYIVPSSISDPLLNMLRISKLLLVFGFFVLVPVIRRVFKDRSHFFPEILGLVLLLLVVVSSLKGIVIGKTQGFLVETSAFNTILLETLLVVIPILLLYFAERHEPRNLNLIENNS
jgi:hypothetical protein